MNSFQNRKFFIVLSSLFMTQAAWDNPIADGDLDKRFPQITPTAPSKQVTREQTRDCTGEYVIAEQLTSRLYRLRFGFYPSAQMLAGCFAYAYSAAASPTGTPQNEEQVIKTTNTAGSPKFSLNFEGLSGTSEGIPFNATAAEAQAILEKIRPIKAGNISVSGVALNDVAGLTVEFINKLGKANIPLLVPSENGATGGTTTVSAGQNGANKLHAISRTTSDQPSIFSFIAGFDGDATNPRKYKNAVMNSVRVSGAARGKVQAELDIICSADLIEVIGFVLSECANYLPINTSDCRLEFGGEFITEQLREFSFEYSNNILTGEDAFPFDDIDAIRLESGDRTSSFTFQVFGSAGDSFYDDAENEITDELKLHVGQAGDRVSVISPATKLRLADNPIVFVGDANRSAYNVEGLPLLESGTAGTPDHIEANIAQTTAFLTT